MMKGNKRFIANLLLPLVGIAIILYYTVCGQSCAYLKGGLLGINLTYLGLAFAGLLFVLTLLRQEALRLFLLSAGVGTEIYLVSFQVKQGVYCPYCLLFGLVLLILFVLNFRMSRKFLIAIAVVLGFLVFWLFFEGSTTPLLADDNFVMPTFGNGKVKVRIYTDYFCGPCAQLEPKLEGILANLIKKNIASVTFIDTPIHAPTPLYARYFLFILNDKHDFDYVLRMRALLFEAAKNNIIEKEKLEEYLARNQVKYKQLDTKPVFTALNKYLQEDGINSTPTVVIYEGQNKGTHKGAPEILKAFEGLK